MSAPERSERDLTTRALAGDEAAFADLFAVHERGLYNLCYRLTASREDAADLTQEAFLRVFGRLGELEGREVNLAAYLYRTARNLAYDQVSRRRREAPLEDVSLVAGADEALERDPERTALLLRQQEEVRAANGRLPERHRLVLALREMDERSYAEIGEVLEINQGAVAQLLVRARLGLRRELRLEQVDTARMAPACRDRLAEIGALIDGELDADRRQVLSAHMAGCERCRASRAAFEEARVTYRTWLPLLAIGLGAATARAAEARGLLGEGREDRRRRRGRRALIAAALLGSLAVVAAVPTVVSNRQESRPTTAEPTEAEAVTAPARPVTRRVERSPRSSPRAVTRPPAGVPAPALGSAAPAASAAPQPPAGATAAAQPPPRPRPATTTAAPDPPPARPARRARVATAAAPTPAVTTPAPPPESATTAAPPAIEPPPAEPPPTTTEAPATPPVLTDPPPSQPPRRPPRLTATVPIRPPQLPPPTTPVP